MPIRVMSPEKFVEAVNAEGCDISLAQLKALVIALTKIGVKRSLKMVSETLHGRALEQKRVIVEEMLDQDEPFHRKALRASLDAFINRSHAIGRWFEDPAPKDSELITK